MMIAHDAQRTNSHALYDFYFASKCAHCNRVFNNVHHTNQRLKTGFRMRYLVNSCNQMKAGLPQETKM